MYIFPIENGDFPLPFVSLPEGIGFFHIPSALSTVTYNPSRTVYNPSRTVSAFFLQGCVGASNG